MGTCWNCGVQITLKEGRTDCDNCGEILRYYCNSCKKPFDIEDKKTKKALHECPACGFFQCPHCNSCSSTCPKEKWSLEIYEIMKDGDVPVIPNLGDKIKRIVNLMVEKKISIDRKNCPVRGVPISYAKTAIKGLLARIEGFRVKDDIDREAFLQRLDEITEIPIGETVTVSKVREKGSYGQEYRDAFNLAVCMGKFEIKKKVHKESKKEYSVFVRCEKPVCSYLMKDDLIIKQCSNCKKRYPRNVNYCEECSPYKKGKRKGEYRELKERLNDKDTCQMYRGHFVKGNGKT